MCVQPVDTHMYCFHAHYYKPNISYMCQDNISHVANAVWIKAHDNIRSPTIRTD